MRRTQEHRGRRSNLPLGTHECAGEFAAGLIVVVFAQIELRQTGLKLTGSFRSKTGGSFPPQPSFKFSKMVPRCFTSGSAWPTGRVDGVAGTAVRTEEPRPAEEALLVKV